MYDLSENKIKELKEIVEKIENFNGKWVEIKENIPHPFYNELAQIAMKFLYENNLIIKFNWSKWDEGKEFFKNNNLNKYDNIDREYILKLLTAIARKDRFCDGAWGNLFESNVANILYKKLLETY
jgi:hypothetical protein